MNLNKPGTRINSRFVIAVRENEDGTTELWFSTGDTFLIASPIECDGDYLVVQEPL